MNRRNANGGCGPVHVNFPYDRKSRFSEILLGAVSGIALLTASIGFSQPAIAASGGGAIAPSVSGPKGGAGGVDGDPAAAKGKDGVAGGAVSGGGGGAVNLTTGQGMSGGNRSSGGTAGETGLTGAINTPVVTGEILGGAGERPISGIGGGGGGGVGITTDQNLTIMATGVVVGGLGATGLSTSGGGGGGVAIFSTSNVIIEAGASINGGGGGVAANYSGGGGGAAAVLLAGGGVLTNSGTITGGAGGRGANPALLANGGAGGNGGEGVLLTNGGTIINNVGGSITGGNSGVNGSRLSLFDVTLSQGGNGVAGANITVVNAGVISGAAIVGGGFVDAIKFTGGKNSLELHSTSVINGSVKAFSSDDMLILGGGDNGTFDASKIGDASQFSGFGAYEKTGASVWTLSGTTATLTPWVINSGALSIAADDSLGAVSGDLTLNGGTLLTTDSFSMDRNVILTAAGGAIDTLTNSTLTINGVLSGDGDLTKTSDGTLVLTGENTYTGGTTIRSGILQLGNGGTIGSLKGDVAVAMNSAFNINRNDIVTFDGTISGDGSFSQVGTGTTILTSNNSHTGGTTISSGTLQLGNGGSSGSIAGDVTNNGALVFNRSGTTIQSGIISGTGDVRQAGAGITQLKSVNTYTGKTIVEAGTLAARAENVLSAGSAYSVLNGGTLDLSGYNQTIASLANAGTVSLRGANDAAGTILKITGNYTGTGGTILLNSALGEDNSKTDRLTINGNSSGSASLRVNNISSTGGVTVEGIKLVQIGGNSDATFALQGDYAFKGEQAVASGAYAYRLYKNGVSTPTDGDWYLRSTLKNPTSIDPTNPTKPVDPTTPATPLYNAAVPVFEAYAGVLLNLNTVSTLQQRVGDRYLGDNKGTRTDGQSTSPQGHSSAIWGRLEAAHSKYQPKTSTSATDYELDTWKMEAGLDGQLYEDTNGKLIGGLSAHYVNASADASSLFGNGKIDVDGYGVASTLTWYGQNGFYVDGQAQATWYNSDLFSNELNRGLANGNSAFGYVVSVETGKHFALNPNWMLTPQAQLVYSSVDFDSFDMSFISGSARTSLGKADSLKARLAISADHQNSWIGADGKTTRTNIYGIANLYQEFLDGTNVNISGVDFASENDRTWGGIGTGGSYSWANDKYSLYGEVSFNTSLSRLADSYNINGKTGFKVAF